MTRAKKTLLQPFYQAGIINECFVKIQRDVAVEIKLLPQPMPIARRRATIACERITDEMLHLDGDVPSDSAALPADAESALSAMNVLLEGTAVLPEEVAPLPEPTESALPELESVPEDENLHLSYSSDSEEKSGDDIDEYISDDDKIVTQMANSSNEQNLPDSAGLPSLPEGSELQQFHAGNDSEKVALENG